ncbi:MAG: hypothetical protein SF339_15945 [Blastocatellia bacterium]|nr:hypothetical protein [Blastocatellia bacterium]
MKKLPLCRFALTALFLFLGAASTPAQSLEKLLTIQVPFDFQIGDKALPAGEYVVQRDPQMPQHLQIQCPRRNLSVIVFTFPLTLAKPLTRPSLTFKEYGDKRFLTEVRVAKYGYGYALTKGKAERRLAQAVKAAKSRTIPDAGQKNN